MKRIATILLLMLFASSLWGKKQEATFADKVAVAQRTIVQISQNIGITGMNKLADAHATMRSCFPDGDNTPLANLYHPSGFNVGTGFIVNNKGDVVTADHVVKLIIRLEACLAQYQVTPHNLIGLQVPNSDMRIIAPNLELANSGFSSAVQFTIIAEDPAHDVAVLTPQRNLFHNSNIIISDTNGRSQTFNLNATKLNPNDQVARLNLNRPRDGSDIFTCGYPLNAPSSVTTSGRIASAWSEKILANAVNNGITQQSETYTLDLRINHGNSGGPLFSTDDGSVLGIIVEISPTTIENGVAFAVPAKYIAVLLDKSKIPWVSVGEKRKKADPEGSAR